MNVVRTIILLESEMSFVQNKCCGFDNSTEDFKNSVFSTNTGLLYPKACCVNMKDPTCDGLTIEEGLLHQAVRTQTPPRRERIPRLFFFINW